MIPVTKPFLPPRSRLNYFLDRIYESNQVTNNGPLVQELTERLEEKLGVQNILLVANGTMAIQVALAALEIRKGTGITTPFTFPATSSALVWQGVEPRYAAIDPKTLNLDPTAAEKVVTTSTEVVLPVHTYGTPCDVEKFEEMARKHHLRLIYDASHAFGVRLEGQSLLNWGDASTISFHATKLFHTGEGGAIVFRDPSHLEAANSLINFGLKNGVPERVGINAKLSELHAAMGLAVLESIDEIIESRLVIQAHYREKLSNWVNLPAANASVDLNGAYFPILCEHKAQRDRVRRHLMANGIESRAYFSPSLDSLGLYTSAKSTLGTYFSDRVLCLPIFYGLSRLDVDRICDVVIAGCSENVPSN